MSQLQREMMTVETFMEVYGISRSKFYKQVNAGLLKITKLDRLTFVKRTDAEAWLSNIGEKD